MPSIGLRACPLRGQVDPRLLRFSAGATAGTLAVALLVMDGARPLGLGLLASQVAVFAFTAFVSFQWSLWAQIFARFIWPRIDVAGYGLTALAFGLSALNASTGLCVGCTVYELIRRPRSA